MIIDQLTLNLGFSIILLAIIALLTSPFLCKIKSQNRENIETELPPISIIIPTHDNFSELQRNLPIFLRQQYAGSYQVIVVADKGDHETEDFMKRLMSEYNNLYATYLPDSSRYMSRIKLAITLGVKAAKTDWISITDPTCRPADESWLASWGQNMTADTDFVMGYVALDNKTPVTWRFEHALKANKCLRAGQRGKTWATNCQNIAFRKSHFMKGEGFRGNLQLIRGEYDFLANKYGRNNATRIDIRRSSWLYEEEPSRKTWYNRKIYFRASRPLLKGYMGNRLCTLFENMTLHLSFLASLACGVFAGIMQNWILLGCTFFSLLLLIIGRTILASKAISHLDENIGKGSMFFLEMLLAWRNLRYKFCYIHADKSDFTSHKL